MNETIVKPTALCTCGHTKTVAAAGVRVNGVGVEGNVERVRCANCGEPRWVTR